MRKCYISKNYKDISGAGNKAKTDIEYSLEQAGFVNIGYKQTQYSNKLISYFITIYGVLKALQSMKAGDVVVLQYPWKKYYDLICRKARKKGAKTITIIHDLGSFRRKKLTEEQEVARLNQSDYIVAHNPSMKKWLEERGVKSKMFNLEVFDYLSDSKPVKDLPSMEKYIITFAGQLTPKKCSFLYDLLSEEQSYIFDLYGSGLDANLREFKSQYNFHGFIKSDNLISEAKSHFGLVWDGDSVDCCDGTFGVYLKYNNPHKTSLYLRCHLPVIIWKHAALASFVEENKIGICVDSLNELPDILSSLSEQEYKEMKEAVIKVSDRLASGYYVTAVLEQIMSCFFVLEE